MNKHADLLKGFALCAAVELALFAALWAGAQASMGNMVPARCWALSFAALTAAVWAGFAVKGKAKARRGRTAFLSARRKASLAAYSARNAGTLKKAG